MNLIKLNQKGVAHWLVGALVVAIVAVIGVKVLTASHAQSNPSVAGVTVAYSTKSVSNCPGVTSVYVPPSDPTVEQQNPGVLSPTGIAPSSALTSMIIANHPKFEQSISCVSNKKIKDSAYPQGICQPGDIIIVCPTLNWSGYGSNYSGIEGVSMSWNVPGIQKVYNSNPINSVPDGGAYTAVWDGIGGGQEGGSPTLLQAGTASNSFCDQGETCTQQYFPWYEMYPGEDQVMLKDWPINIGDQMFSAVAYSPGTNQASFMICDFAKTVNRCVITEESVQGITGTGAEWIMERPTISDISGPSIEPHLADFGNVNITNAQVLNSTDPQWQPMGSNINIAYDMVDCAGNELAGGVRPNPGDTNLTINWYGFGYRSPQNWNLNEANNPPPNDPNYQAQNCKNP